MRSVGVFHEGACCQIQPPVQNQLTPNERWSLDFVSDAFTDGRRFRVLAVVDDFTRECLALVADTSLSGRRLARELDAVIARRGKPLLSDQGLPYDILVDVDVKGFMSDIV